MPTSTSSGRKTAPRQATDKRRESIAAFEQWQRNWFASFSAQGAAPIAKRTLAKHAGHHAHSR